MDAGLIVAIAMAIGICYVAWLILKALFTMAIKAFQFMGALAVALIPGLVIFFISDAALASTIESAGIGATSAAALAVMAHSTLG
ncbi:MAG: hypothetical protein ABJL72_10885 [Roseobacter sp.]